MTDFQSSIKSRVAEIAQQILDDEIGLVEGCRSLVRLSAQLEDKDNDLLMPIFAVESETDRLPVGETRSLWCPEALAEKEKAVQPYLDQMGSDVREVCRALIRRYSPARPQEQSPQEAGIGTNAPKSRKGKCPLSAETVAFVGALVYRFPALLPVLEEHLQDQDGEVLSHVFFGDLTRWIVGRLETAGRKDRILREILDFMEHAFGRGEGEVQELIAVSFLENLPSPGEPGSEIRSLLGPLLQEQLKRMRL